MTLRMPVSLSPRGRRVVMAAVIALVVWAFLRSPEADDGILAPVPLDATIKQVAVPRSATHTSLSRPSISLDAITGTSSDLSPFGLLDDISGLRSPIDSLEALLSHPLSDATLDWPNALFAQNIDTAPTGCVGCVGLFSSVGGFRPVGFSGGGGVSGAASGGSGAAGPGSVHDNLYVEAVESLLEWNSTLGAGENHGLSDWENSGQLPSQPNTFQTPSLMADLPGGQPPLSVPEPSTMVLLATGAGGAVLRRGLARKRRG